MLFQEGLPDNRCSCQEAGAVVRHLIPLIGQRKGCFQLIILRFCCSDKGLRKNSDSVRILLQKCGDLACLRVELQSAVRNVVCVQKIVHRILRGCSLTGCQDRFAGQILYGCDALIGGDTVENAECIDIQNGNSALCLVVKGSRKVCRNQCNVKISGGNGGYDLRRIRSHRKLIFSLRPFLIRSLHQIDQSHCGRSLEGAYADRGSIIVQYGVRSICVFRIRGLRAFFGRSRLCICFLCIRSSLSGLSRRCLFGTCFRDLCPRILRSAASRQQTSSQDSCYHCAHYPVLHVTFSFRFLPPLCPLFRPIRKNARARARRTKTVLIIGNPPALPQGKTGGFCLFICNLTVRILPTPPVQGPYRFCKEDHDPFRSSYRGCRNDPRGCNMPESRHSASRPPSCAPRRRRA